MSDFYPSNWQRVRLRDIGYLDRGRSRHRPRYAEHLYGGVYPFIQTGDVKAANGRITTYSQTYSEAGLAQSRLWPAGTMCITIAANIAETAILSFPACFPDSIIGFIGDEAKCDVFFIEYMFRCLRNQIQSEATGSVQDNINLSTFDRLYFPLPPLPEQHAIADILSAFDDKIDLNRRMNATLEATARALFQSWFVDFDPVHAKAAGRSPEGMDADTAALFPDSFEESALGLIPSGWRIRQLAEVAELVDCLHSKKPDAVAEGNLLLQVYNIGENGRIDLTKPYFITAEDYTLWTRRIEVTEGDLVITNTGRVGAVAQIPRGVKAALGRNMVGIRAKRNFALARFLKDYLVSNEMRREITLQTSLGTILESLHVRSVSKLRLCLPPKELIETYEMLVAPLHDQMDENDFQSRTLAETRDALLPKLISGQVRVGGKS